MRVVIVDRPIKNGRRVAADVENVAPKADVLLYDDPQQALAGVVEHAPDVVLVGARLGAVDGPQFIREASALDGMKSAKFVGVVDKPSAEMSQRYVDAGAVLVVGRPLDATALRAALRHAGDGVTT
jgi:DNA-binding NarL/FixJ family response regulator